MMKTKTNQKTKMMNNLEINIFIENEYEDFCENLDVAKLTRDSEFMVKTFLKNSTWVEQSCLKDYDFSQLCFDVVLMNNEKIHEINREYREKDSPTDVITFAIFADSPKAERFFFDGEINLGEILISLDKTKEQAEDSSHHKDSFEDELKFLLAHGILHLLGYDHQDEDTLKLMWDIQEEMIKGI